MPTYTDSAFLIGKDNASVLLSHVNPSFSEEYFYSDSTFLIGKDNVSVLLKHVNPSFSEEYFYSDSGFLLGKVNIQFAERGPDNLHTFPHEAFLRQIHTDSNYVYAATSRGLVVFST